MPAYAYLRKSSVRDVAREVSPAMQEDAVRALAARHGDDELTILSDWDKSGRLGREKRPGYNALLMAIESGECTAVYSYSLSRLGRSLPELARLVDDLTKREIPVRLSADAIDTSTATGKFTAHILMAAAQLESDLASERVRGSIATRMAHGEFIPSTKPFGQQDGEDAGVVMAAFREAGSYSGAAKLLNAAGVKPRNSKKGIWWPSSVSVVVRRQDPTIAARPSSRGSRTLGGFALQRLLRCPTCGTMLSGTRDRVDGPNKGRVRYACRLGTVTPHPRVTVSEHLILPKIQEEVARLRTPEEIEELSDASGERAEIESRRMRILDMYEANLITKAERDERLGGVSRQLASLDTKRMIKSVPKIRWDWPPRELNTVLRLLFDEITLHPASFQPVAFKWAIEEWRAA